MAGEPPFDFHDHRPWSRPIAGDELIGPLEPRGSIVATSDGPVPFSPISSDASDVASPTELIAAIGAIEPARPSHVDRTREPADRARGSA